MSKLLMKNNQKQFWVSNISNKNVCLADLALTIPARRHMNLLDSDHFTYTEEQLEKSKQSGSLFKKGRLIRIREVAPVEQAVKAGMYVSKLPIVLRQKLKSTFIAEETKYEELEVSEEKFADEMTTEES